MTEPRLAVVLGSGSARGLAHIGVLEVFEREGVPIDLIVGTSIGALIGGVYACGISAKEMAKIANSIDMRRLVSLADITRPSTALINGHRIERFIRGLIGSQTFEDTQVPFACVAVDVEGEEQVVLQDGDLPSAIRASLSTPILFAPANYDGRLLVDGAVLNPVPVDIAREMDARTIVAVTNSGIPRGARPVFYNEAGIDRSEPDAGADGSTRGLKNGSLRDARLRDVGFREWMLRDRGLMDRGRRFPRRVYTSAITYAIEKVKSPNVYQLAAGSLDLMQRELSEPRLEQADIVIAPLIDSTTYYSFHESERMIAAGRLAAEAALDELEKLLTSSSSGRATPEEPADCRTEELARR